MAKKYQPNEAKPFQPLKSSLLRQVLNEPAPEVGEGNVATIAEPEPSPPVAAAVQAEADERKVVPMQTEQPAPVRRARALPAPAGGERLNRPLKVQLQSSERIELTRIVNELSSTLGTPLSMSHVTRALLNVFRHAESEVHKRARERGSLRRPPNDDLTAIAVFEHELAKLLLGAIRNAKALRE